VGFSPLHRRSGVSDGLKRSRTATSRTPIIRRFPSPAATPWYTREPLEWRRLFLSGRARRSSSHTASSRRTDSRGRSSRAKTFRGPIPAAAAYVLGRTRWHSSFGTASAAGGIRLGVHQQPPLSSRATRSFDAGVGARLFHDRLALDATYFYNRFLRSDVTLGGSLSQLVFIRRITIANSGTGRGVKAKLRPARLGLTSPLVHRA